MDIVEFAERVCNFNLSDWQREYLRKAYYAYKNNKRFIYIPPRGNNKRSLEILQSLAIIFSANKKGLIKNDGLKTDCLLIDEAHYIAEIINVKED